MSFSKTKYAGSTLHRALWTNCAPCTLRCAPWTNCSVNQFLLWGEGDIRVCMLHPMYHSGRGAAVLVLTQICMQRLTFSKSKYIFHRFVQSGCIAEPISRNVSSARTEKSCVVSAAPEDMASAGSSHVLRQKTCLLSQQRTCLLSQHKWHVLCRNIPHVFYCNRRRVFCCNRRHVFCCVNLFTSIQIYQNTLKNTYIEFLWNPNTFKSTYSNPFKSI